jgi:DUF1365 family protein
VIIHTCDGFKIYFAKTTHSRFHPVLHSFSYPLFYFGVTKTPFRFGLFTVNDSLDLDSTFTQLGYSGPRGFVELVTTPRFLGYAFNPLSIYIVRASKNEKISAVLLQVTNTFNEKLVYLCHVGNQLNTTKRGYTNSYIVERSFHVSPFNNRSGCYHVHILDSPNLDLVLILEHIQL